MTYLGLIQLTDDAFGDIIIGKSSLDDLVITKFICAVAILPSNGDYHLC